MNILSKSFIGVLAFSGAITTATAAGVITDISGVGGGLGSFGVLNNSIVPKQLNLIKTFDSVAAINVVFTVVHAQGAGGPYSVTETITNNTGVTWTDFHLSIPTGMVFNNFQSASLTGFTLDSPPASGSHDLNFTGSLASGATTTAKFNLTLPDPGAGNYTSLTLMQSPSVSVSPIPEPETYGMLMAGLGLMGFVVRRRTTTLRG
jgi:hypothetical protein